MLSLSKHRAQCFDKLSMNGFCEWEYPQGLFMLSLSIRRRPKVSVGRYTPSPSKTVLGTPERSERRNSIAAAPLGLHRRVIRPQEGVCLKLLVEPRRHSPFAA